MHVSDPYSHVLEKARWSYAHGRSVSHILPSDVETARLFSYGYRAQTIGTFHATRLAVAEEAHTGNGSYAGADLKQAAVLLEQLQSKALDPILDDPRALISTFYWYDRLTNLVLETLEKDSSGGAHPRLETIRHRFLQNVERVTAGNGLYITRDLELPEQGSFVVPDLNISIAPIIYGDHHSWNAAFLVGDQPGVSVHFHHQGAEIHLGYSPVKGQTILGDNFAPVDEGYAMAIPPMTDHGFFNTSGHDHVVPFVFGSMKLAGWGVFFDVEPRPGERVPRKEQPLESEAMNHSVFLERAIGQMKSAHGFSRQVLVPAHRAGSSEIGGLELTLTRTGQNFTETPADQYRIVSVQSGKGRVRIGEAEAEVCEHDHFGVPAGMEFRITSSGTEPLVFLDAVLLPLHTPELHRSQSVVSSGIRE